MPLEMAQLVPRSDPNKPLKVQFNPQSLRVNYRAMGAVGIQRAAEGGEASGARTQRTGFSAGLTMELFFDTSETGDDVRNATLPIANLLQAQSKTEAPTVDFQWGTFLFSGTVDSMDETLDLFSEGGVPLRATVNLSMSATAPDQFRQGGAGGGGGAGLAAGFSAGVGVSAGVSVGASFSAGASLSAGAAIGTTPLTLARSGDTLQGLSARAGADWKAVASANNVDNPRLLQPGAVLNLNARASAGTR